MQKYIDALEREKSDDIRKYNILAIPKNVGSIFTGTYFHYKDVPRETVFEKLSQREQNWEKQDLMRLEQKKRT